MAAHYSVPKPKTALCKVLEVCPDIGGYIIYVFEILDPVVIKQEQSTYLMCVRYPNWNQGPIEVGDVGYLQYKIVFEGISGWFDGDNLLPYNYTDRVFLKFIHKKEKPNGEFIID